MVRINEKKDQNLTVLNKSAFKFKTMNLNFSNWIDD